MLKKRQGSWEELIQVGLEALAPSGMAKSC